MTNPSTNFQLFQTGETDYDAFTSRPDDIEQLKMLGFANINLYGSSDYSRVEFNVRRPALKDVKVRRALIYGLDRQKLIDVVYGDTARWRLSLSRRSHGHGTPRVNPYHYDPAQAKSCLTKPAGNRGRTVSASKRANARS